MLLFPIVYRSVYESPLKTSYVSRLPTEFYGNEEYLYIKICNISSCFSKTFDVGH